MAACARCGATMSEGSRFCAACGAPLEPAPATEERKLSTVVFADLVGSTALGGSQDPERTRAMLDRFYDAMSAEVEAAGGTVEKFAGDAVMAVFGVPAAHEDDAERALHAALAMRRRLLELFGDDLALRIGVDTGEVVVGRPRQGSSFVTGDAVNAAARLEQSAHTGEILVGTRTAAAARGAFAFSEEQIVDAKGKPHGIAAHRLLRPIARTRMRGVSGMSQTFVGREAELKLLTDAYRTAVDVDAPQLVTVVGEAGVGKTALARRLWEELGEMSPPPLRAVGRCLSYGRGITYAPFSEILRAHFALRESDPAAAVLARLGHRPILGLTLGLDVAGDLHPLAARERLQEEWVDLLGELTRERPAVLVVEDLHWGEEPLLDLLERVVDDVRGPLLVVATARPDLLDHRRGRLGERGTLLELDALTPAESRQMFDELLSASSTAPIRNLVLERAEGNPFFLEELLAALVDRGVLRRLNGVWTAAQLPDDFAMPDSVQAVLAARTDLLARAEKEALQAAAVIGRIFWTSAVYELLPGVSPDLRVLEDRDFIRRRPDSAMQGEREYAIKHALTREVAYGSVPKAKRARLHARFADWLERRGAGRDEHAALLAHHYAEAVKPEDFDLAWAGALEEGERVREKAAAWLRRAAELAVGRYEIDDAIVLLERALRLARDDAERAGVWRAIGEARALKYDGEGFWAAMQTAIAATTDPQAAAEMYGQLALQTALRPAMWKRNPNSALVDDWIERAVGLADARSRALAQAFLARALWHRTDRRAEDDARTAAEIADGLGSVELRSYAFSARALAALASADYTEAERSTARRLEILSELTDPDHRADVYWSAVLVNASLGRIVEARRLARLNDEINSQLTPHHRVHGIASLVRAEELAAHWDAIVNLQPVAEQRVAANGDTPCSDNVFCLLVCALAQAHVGNDAEAARLERTAEELGIEGYIQDLTAPRLRIAILRGDLERIDELLAALPGDAVPSLSTNAARLDGLLALGRTSELEAEAARLLHPGTYLEPFVLRALGVARNDGALLEQAVERFRAMGLDWHAEQTPVLAV